MKPTYGMVSRYGVQAMASSLDQVWVFARTVEDAEILLKAIVGFDPHDSQSHPQADDFVTAPLVDQDAVVRASHFTIGVPKEVLWEWLDPRIKERFLFVIDMLRSHDVHVEEISLPLLSYAVPMYYTLMPAEVSTNLARFDGIRFGLQEDTKGMKDLFAYYAHIRSTWFGEEVKRRILLWTFVLSSQHYEWYYMKAQKARWALQQWFDRLFTSYDIILTPTTPELARRLGERSDDPLKTYLADMYTIPANMAWLPAMSLPMWVAKEGEESLPMGIQLMGQRWSEWKIFAFARYLEQLLSADIDS